MSFVRFGTDDSDLYVYDDVAGGLCCCGCLLHDRPFASFYFGTNYDALIAHLNHHTESGHHVPEWLEEVIRADQRDRAEEKEGPT